jgi:hypothetical protein
MEEKEKGSIYIKWSIKTQNCLYSLSTAHIWELLATKALKYARFGMVESQTEEVVESSDGVWLAAVAVPWQRKTSALGEEEAGSHPHVKSCTPLGFITYSCRIIQPSKWLFLETKTHRKSDRACTIVIYICNQSKDQAWIDFWGSPRGIPHPSSWSTRKN